MWRAAKTSTRLILHIYIYGAYPGAHQNIILQEIDARFFLMFFAIYIYGAYPGAHQIDARFVLMVFAIYIYMAHTPAHTRFSLYGLVAPAPPSQIKEETQI